MVALYFGANQVLFPAIVDNLINKTLAWEYEKKKQFLYDGVSSLSYMSSLRDAFFVALFSKFFNYLQARLVLVLEEYKVTRQQKEEEKKKFRVIQLAFIHIHHCEICCVS